MRISLPPEKRLKWSTLIVSYLKDGRISHRCLDKLIGRLSIHKQPSLGSLRELSSAPCTGSSTAEFIPLSYLLTNDRFWNGGPQLLLNLLLAWLALALSNPTGSFIRTRLPSRRGSAPCCSMGAAVRPTFTPVTLPRWISRGHICSAVPTSFMAWGSWISSYFSRKRHPSCKAPVVGSILTTTTAWPR